MTYEAFQRKIDKLASKHGLKASFSKDEEKGKYFANCDGVTFIGNSTSLSLTVRWGSGHQSMVKS